MDVGVVTVRNTNDRGIREQRQYEVDFVCNLGSKRYYIQSAYRPECLGSYRIQRGDFLNEKFSDNGTANGDLKSRAPTGHDFTQAQQLIHNEASMDKSFLTAPDGHTLMQVPQPVHSSLLYFGTNL